MTKLTKAIRLSRDSAKEVMIELHRVLSPATLAALAADQMGRDIMLIGVGRIMADTMAGAKTDAEREAAVTKKFDAWLAGEFNVRGGGGAGETIEGEVKRLLVAAFMAAKGVPESKASAALKGKGFEVLRNIANSKAIALQPELPGEITDEVLAAHNAKVAATSDKLFDEAKATWTAKAEASLAAKQAAREAAKDFDVADLI